MNEQNTLQKLQGIEQNIAKALKQLQADSQAPSHQVVNNLNSALTEVQGMIQASSQTQSAGGRG